MDVRAVFSATVVSGVLLVDSALSVRLAASESRIANFKSASWGVIYGEIQVRFIGTPSTMVPRSGAST